MRPQAFATPYCRQSDTSKDGEIVEYTLNRTLSPALVAEYQTQLPDKKLFQAKLHELYLLTTKE
jgi:hypothetical protein